MEDVAEFILRDRRIAYLLVDRSLRIKEVHDAIGLWADSNLAQPGASLVDLVPELVGSEEILYQLEQEPDSRLELDLVNRSGPDGSTTYWKLVALPRQSGPLGAAGLIFLAEDVSELGIQHQYIMQNYNELLLLQRELARKNLQLAAANAELQNLAEMKSVFVSVAAHELRNPLAVIHGYADMLLGDPAGDLTARQQDGLEIVKRSSVHLLEITNNLLDLARIELGRVDLLLQPLELERLIRVVVREFQPRLDVAGQQVDVRVDPGLPLVLCDETRACQILRNIVSNAHKYMPPNGKIGIHLGPADNPHELLVAISDTGVGIPMEDQSKLFSRFFRARNASDTGASGTGLGLHITRLLVELHGGRVWFESKISQGTTFYITFQVAGDLADADALGPRQSTPQKELTYGH